MTGLKTPSALTDYATDQDVVDAVDELRDCARVLTAELRAARAEARKAHVLFDFRPRSRSGMDAARAMKRALPADAQRVVARAEELARNRDACTRAANYLGWVGADLARATIIAATKPAVLDACPTFKAIIGRWRAALEGNGEKMLSARGAAKLAHREAQLDSLLRRIEKLAGRG